MSVTGTVNWKRQFKWQAQCAECHKRSETKGEQAVSKDDISYDYNEQFNTTNTSIAVYGINIQLVKEGKKKAIKQGEKKKLAYLCN